MSPSDETDAAPLKEYVGIIWIGDQPGVRICVWARCARDARAAVCAEHGEGHPMTLWNEDDANKSRTNV